MDGPRFSSVAEQVAEVLRAGVRRGQWRGRMPGRLSLAKELGVNHKTVEAALRLLEADGLLEARGAGRVRRISGNARLSGTRLRVMILLYEQADTHTDYIVELRHRLLEAGHLADFASKTMNGLGMNVKRIARFVESQEADAWVVVAGPRDVLEWFAAGSTPTFALFGRFMESSLAATAPVKRWAYAELIDRLVLLGHRRIVSVVREDRRKPTPGLLDRFFLDHLRSHGIETGPYNLPDWDDTPEGLQRLLDSLFKHTPPTALLLDEPALFLAARDHLARRGVMSPDKVSLACCDDTPAFAWCRPAVTRITWESAPLVTRVVRWADSVSLGKDDRRKSFTKARLVVGGTIGPAP